MTVTITPTEAWDYYQSHKEELKTSMHRIAENLDFGTEVYITEDEGSAAVVVTADDEEVLREPIVDREDCQDAVRRAFDSYLTSKYLSAIGGNDEDDGDELYIAEREDELSEAIVDFISAVAPDDCCTIGMDMFDPEMIEDLKDHFLEYMYRKWKISPYRPMYLRFDDGDELLDYPYEEMEFEDEKNPIYK